MHRFALALLAAVALVSSAYALPEDGNRYHLIVVTADTPTGSGQSLLSTMRQHPKVSQVSIRCHTHHFRTSDTIYRERYIRSLPPAELPILALADSSGGVVYKASGDAVPADGDGIYEALVAAAKLDQAIPKETRQGFYASSYSYGRPYAYPVGYRGQCGPDGCEPQPYQPNTPDFRTPGGIVDQAVPDSVDVDADARLFEVPQWVWIGGVTGVLLLCLAGCFIVAGIAIAVVLFLRR